MRIPLDQITSAGFKITASADDDWVAKATQSVRGTPGEPTADPHEDEGAETATIRFTLRPRSDQITASGDIELTIRCACDRCGSSVILTITGQFDQLYKPPGEDQSEVDHDLITDELDVGWHDGQAIDLEVVLTEALALNGPGRVRCDDNNVQRIEGDGPCELPAEALEGGPTRANPFAGLKLSE
jgi:uncharacterized metal-binding protein YceD (DUF177 family)